MQNDEKMAILKDLGLSDEEIGVYTCLLKLGGTNATTLSKHAGLKRTTVYPILERLISKEIVTSYDRGTKRFYVPTKPDRLGNLFERKLLDLQKIIPILEKMQGTNAESYGVRFLQSKQELKSFYNGILEEYRNKEYYIIGSATSFINLDREFILDFRKKRAAQGTCVKLLLTSDSRSEVGQQDPSLHREYKYLPEKYSFKSTIDIYDDKIIIVGPEIKSLAVVIAIPPMVDVFRSVFEILWETLN